MVSLNFLSTIFRLRHDNERFFDEIFFPIDLPLSFLLLRFLLNLVEFAVLLVGMFFSLL